MSARHIPLVRRADRLAAEIDAGLAARKAQRPAYHQRSLKGAATKRRRAYEGDRLRNEQVAQTS